MATPNYRQQVAAALLAQVKAGSYAFTTLDRAAKIVTQVVPAMQPACFVLKGGERTLQDTSWGLAKHLFLFTLLIYLRADGEQAGTWPDDIETVLQAIDAAFAVKQGGRLTLGGLVEHCWIEGETMIDNPVIQEQIAIWIPIHVLTGRQAA